MKNLLIIPTIMILIGGCNKKDSELIYSKWTINGIEYKSNKYVTSIHLPDSGNAIPSASLAVGIDDNGNKDYPWVWLQFNLDHFPKSGEFYFLPVGYNSFNPNCVNPLFFREEDYNKLYTISPYETNNKLIASEEDGMAKYTISSTWFYKYNTEFDNMNRPHAVFTGDSFLVSGEFYMPFK